MKYKVSGNTPADTTHNAFTGFQLQAIPEPASGGLLLLGAAAALGLLRKKLHG